MNRPSDDEVIDVLFEGDDSARARMLHRLSETVAAGGYTSLVHRILRELKERALPGREHVLRSPAQAPVIRSWLLSALRIVMGSNEEAMQTLVRHTNLSFERNEWVRYWSLAGLYWVGFKGVVELSHRIQDQDADEMVKVLARGILARENEKLVYDLRAPLREPNENNKRAVWHVLRALRIVKLPMMAEPIAELLSRTMDLPIPYDALYALSNQLPQAEATALLARKMGAERIAELVVEASRESGQVHVERFSQFFEGLPRDTVVAVLQKAVSDPEPSRVDAARRLLAILGVVAPGDETPWLASVVSDVADGAKAEHDKLDINAEVRTLCSVLLSKSVRPPLSVGLFGDWGSGKSFFMERMRDEIDVLAGLSRDKGEETAFYSRVAQISFNAWHYIDTNLWASLVSHIFDELAGQVAEKKTPEQTKILLLKELETAKAMKAEADAERVAAEAQRQDAEKALAQKAQERAQKEIKLSSLRMADLRKLLAEAKGGPDLEKALAEAMKGLGVPSALSSVEELQDAAKQAHSLAGRAHAALLAFQRDDEAESRVGILIAAVLIGVPALTWGVHWLTQQPFFAWLTAIVGEAAVVISTAATAIKKYGGQANGYLQRFEQARETAVKLIEEKRQERGEQELELEQELVQLRTQENAARERLNQVTAKVVALEQQIKEIDEGRSLSKFLLERVQGDDYRKHLGLISVIRKDFDKLEKLLRDSSDLRTIDRIILYIDDLDRCPADKVVDVLQAVHLLLAVPLFVVVVGVDSRWLLHSLERQFSAFQQSRDRRDGRGGEEWMTTPQSYLEKIFQIPFTLRRMQPSGFQRLMGTFLPRQSAERRTGGSDVPKPPGPGAGSPAPAVNATPSNAISSVPAPSPQASPASSAPSTQLTQSPVNGKADVGTKDKPAETRDLKPRALEVWSWEGEYADRFHAFIPTPRAAKRFANVYRLLKAGVRPSELSAFEGTASTPGNFQAVMILLAILTGFPRQAGAIFSYLLRQRPDAPWRDTFAALKARPQDAQLEADDASAVWRALDPILKATDLPRPELKPFRDWAPKVARYSFEVGHAVGGHVEPEALPAAS